MAAGDDKISGLNIDEQRRIAHEKIANYQKVINDLEKDRLKNGTDNLAQQQELEAELQNIIKQEKEYNSQLQKGVERRTRQLDLAKQLAGQLKIGWKYLQDADKVIKQTNLNLGMAGNKAVLMRDSFEKSAGYVTRLGGTLADIQGVMQGYADETGRARVMSAEMVKNITAIGKGTGLGIEQATRLGAQFELMGFDAKSTMDYVQGVVDTSERMGVNTTKVLKVVNDNFKKLNTYTFQQGVKGFAEMAMYAEKFRIDINQALNAADVARSLEGAIDLAANLQVMGGEFAKTDPFEMLFLSRNDPAKFTEKIADMTKGVVSFRQMSDGTFEKFISPADRDRIANVAKSMGMEASALTEIAERQAEIQRMRTQMGGMGFTKEQKEAVEGAAIFNKESGKFQVKLGDTMVGIRELTSQQAETFLEEQKTLEERAKQAMTFDETLKATVESLKATLLPLLKGVNKILIPIVKVADMVSKLADKGALGIAIAATTLLTGAIAWKLATAKFGMIMSKWAAGGGGKSVIGNAFGGGRAAGGGKIIGGIGAGEPGSMFTKTGMVRKGGAGLIKAQGVASMAKGAGVGAAGAGIGGGIMLAAKGIGELAQSIKDVDVEKLKQMNVTVAILGGTMAAILVPAIYAMGAAGTAGAVGLLAVGAAAVGIGFSINLATKGIGQMAEGFATMFTAIKDVDNMTEVTAGLAGMMAVLTTATITLPSAIGLGIAMGKIGKHADGIVKVGAAMEKITTSLSGSRDDYIAVEKAVKSISNTNFNNLKPLSQLTNILNKPLKVEFADKEVNLVSNITLQIDKYKFLEKVNVGAYVTNKQIDTSVDKDAI